MSRLRLLRLPRWRWLDVSDGCVLIGAAVVVGGVALVSIPGAMILGGVLLMLVGLGWPRRSDGTPG